MAFLGTPTHKKGSEMNTFWMILLEYERFNLY